jgi:hypothetical protein
MTRDEEILAHARIMRRRILVALALFAVAAYLLPFAWVLR